MDVDDDVPELYSQQSRRDRLNVFGERRQHSRNATQRPVNIGGGDGNDDDVTPVFNSDQQQPPSRKSLVAGMSRRERFGQWRSPHEQQMVSGGREVSARNVEIGGGELVGGESRRERFSRWRQGSSGRESTVRDVGISGPPRKSLVAGEVRQLRFSSRRDGSGRDVTVRDMRIGESEGARLSLSAGQSRRHRFSRWRDGSGREVTVRNAHIGERQGERLSLNAGLARRHRFARLRQGSGREVTTRSVHIHSDPSVKLPRKSLVAGMSRKDRFASMRDDSARMATTRTFDFGSHSPLFHHDDDALGVIVDGPDYPMMTTPLASSDDDKDAAKPTPLRSILKKPKLFDFDFDEDDEELLPLTQDEVVKRLQFDDFDQVMPPSPQRRSFGHAHSDGDDESGISSDKDDVQVSDSSGIEKDSSVGDDSTSISSSPLDEDDKDDMTHSPSPSSSSSAQDEFRRRRPRISFGTSSVVSGATGSDSNYSFDDVSRDSLWFDDEMRDRRRETTQLIFEARRAGMDLGENDDSFDDDGPRRSKRRKFPPLAYWANERLMFEKNYDEPISVFVPTLNKEHPVSKPTFERVKPRRRRITKKRKKAATKDGDWPTTDDDAERLPVNSRVPLYDAEQRRVMEMTVAKAMRDHNMVTLTQDPEPNEKPLLACKSLDQEDFASGVLIVPPGSEKLPEVTSSVELFYVIKGATNMLEVCMGKDHTSMNRLILSQGDTFFVPIHNQYSLRNLSTSKTAKLFYVLVRQEVYDDLTDESSQKPIVIEAANNTNNNNTNSIKQSE